MSSINENMTKPQVKKSYSTKGNTPYGYRRSCLNKNMYVVCPSEMRQIVRIRNLYLGGKDCWESAQVLRDENVEIRPGLWWTDRSVAKVLKRCGAFGRPLGSDISLYPDPMNISYADALDYESGWKKTEAVSSRELFEKCEIPVFTLQHFCNKIPEIPEIKPHQICQLLLPKEFGASGACINDDWSFTKPMMKYLENIEISYGDGQLQNIKEMCEFIKSHLRMLEERSSREKKWERLVSVMHDKLSEQSLRLAEEYAPMTDFQSSVHNLMREICDHCSKILKSIDGPETTSKVEPTPVIKVEPEVVKVEPTPVIKVEPEVVKVEPTPVIKDEPMTNPSWLIQPPPFVIGSDIPEEYSKHIIDTQLLKYISSIKSEHSFFTKVIYLHEMYIFVNLNIIHLAAPSQRKMLETFPSKSSQHIASIIENSRGSLSKYHKEVCELIKEVGTKCEKML